MLEVNKQGEARRFLELFNGDIGAATAALQAVVPAQSPKKSRVAADAPVVVETVDLAKTYKLGSEKVAALADINIQIRQGEFIAITGESGSGKSTLLQLIGGLDKPGQGIISIDGKDIGKLSDSKLSVFRNRTIGFVFQFFYLQPFLNTEVNLEVPGMFARAQKKERRQRAQELAGAVGLADRLKHLPKELSGGQMQRAAIARALLNKPKILLADEPTGNLDQTTGAAIIDLFDKIRQDYGTTVVVVTHDRGIAERADREIMLNDGKVVRQ